LNVQTGGAGQPIMRCVEMAETPGADLIVRRADPLN
jgi:hypothetical protein